MDRKPWFRSVFLLLLLPALSCAKVGDPLPPLPSRSVLVQDLRMVKSGPDVLLTFSLPATELSRIEIYRISPGAAVSINETDPVAVISGDEIKTFPFVARSYVEVPPDPDNLDGVFAVRARNLRGRRSGFSNQVSWISEEPPAPPTGIRGSTAEKMIRIEWLPPDEDNSAGEGNAIEYLVNFRELTPETSREITDFTFGKTLDFEVRTFRRSGETFLLSAPLRLEGFVPRDVFPPRPPSGLIVVRMVDRVQLSWDDSTEPDLAGYQVYRIRPGGKTERISSLLTISRFVDDSPPEGVACGYRISAVDRWDNESDLSPAVE